MRGLVLLCECLYCTCVCIVIPIYQLQDIYIYKVDTLQEVLTSSSYLLLCTSRRKTDLGPSKRLLNLFCFFYFFFLKLEFNLGLVLFSLIIIFLHTSINLNTANDQSPPPPPNTNTFLLTIPQKLSKRTGSEP